MPQVPNSPSFLSDRVPKCPLSALSTLNAQVLECPSAFSALRASGVRLSEFLECLDSQSASVSQLVSQPVSQLVYNSGSVS